MEAPPYRWIAIIVILITIIFSLVMAIVIPFNQTRADLNQYFDQKNSGTATETPFDASSPTPTPSVTPLPPLATEVIADTIVATATAKPNCTHPALYWLTHPDAWPQNFDLGNFTYTKEEALQFIQSTPTGASNLLFLHLNTAYLNLISGADATAIEEVFTAASEWMSKHPVGGMLLESEAGQAFEMAQVLDSYNEGNLGPGRCPDESSSIAPQGPGISAPVLSVTPSEILLTNVVTPTALASATPTPTRISIQRTYVPPQPTATEKPARRTNPRPTRAAPAPTEPPQPTREPPPTAPPPAIYQEK